jgi:predicted nucleic acid-binding protein
MILMTCESDIDAYNSGFNDALREAIKIIGDFDPYDPYIVGKMKIEERKRALILSIKDLEK